MPLLPWLWIDYCFAEKLMSFLNSILLASQCTLLCRSHWCHGIQLIVIFLFIIPCYCYFAAWHGHWQHHYAHTESQLIITSFYNCFPTCCQYAVTHGQCWCYCTVPASLLLFPFFQVPVFKTLLLLPLLLLSAISSLFCCPWLLCCNRYCCYFHNHCHSLVTSLIYDSILAITVVIGVKLLLLLMSVVHHCQHCSCHSCHSCYCCWWCHHCWLAIVLIIVVLAAVRLSLWQPSASWLMFHFSWSSVCSCWCHYYLQLLGMPTPSNCSFYVFTAAFVVCKCKKVMQQQWHCYMCYH